MVVGRGRTRARGGVTLAEIAEQFLGDLSMRCTAKTVRDARTALHRLLSDTGWTALPDVTRPGLDDWRRARIAGGMSNRTVNRHTIALCAALALAVQMRQIDHHPLTGLRALPTNGRHRKRVARALPDGEIRQMLAAATTIDARHPRRFPREPLLRALILTGCRWHELVSTLWADLDTDHGVLRLRGENAKTGEDRSIPLDPDLFARILLLRHAHVIVCGDVPRGTDRLFLSPAGKPWSKGTANFHRYLSEVLRVARLPKPMPRGASSTCTRPAEPSSRAARARAFRCRSRPGSRESKR